MEGTEPTYRRRAVPVLERLNRSSTWRRGRPGASLHALPLGRDAALLFGRVEGGAAVSHRLATSHRDYVVTTDAAISVNGVHLAAGERASLTGPGAVTIAALGLTDVALLALD